MQAMRMSLMLMALGLMSACSKSPIEHFEQSNAGKALEDCAKSKGTLRITDLTGSGGKEMVGVVLKKFEKELTFQFQLNPSINHAQIVGVRLTGDDQLNRMTVMRTLQTLCGSQAMSMIMPEESNAIRMLDQAKGKAAALQRP
ncbi:MAG: hypothetical protein EBW88_08700 [Betaproteobacteria bacterium]|nr:hypothetical protein [Betaproteobacteria bacterium]